MTLRTKQDGIETVGNNRRGKKRKFALLSVRREAGEKTYSVKNCARVV